MKRPFVILFLLLLQFSFYQVKAQSITGEAVLFGKLAGFGEKADLDLFSELQYIIPKSHNLIIEIKKDSVFSVSVPLTKPEYFRLGRNKLYLSPGDNMEVFIDMKNPQSALFKGRGSEVNTYLKKAAFPKGGSFLEMGLNLKPTPWESYQGLLQLVEERQKELNALKGVSPVFIRLEKARLRADLIKSFQMAEVYIINKFYKEHESFRKLYWEEFRLLSKKMMDSLVRNFVNADYLQIEVYRDIVDKLDFSKAPVAQKQIFEDWKKANTLAFNKIKPENDKSKISLFRPAVDSVQTKKYRDMLVILLNDKMKFGNGDLAKDFEVIQPDGSRTHLSGLKGKVIYIDIWATWCGPCMAEMPNFEKLKEKYRGNDNIAFVSLSVDDKNDAWLESIKERNAGGIQWRIDRPKLVDYGVETVPRYILVDKNFSITEMNAPRAADPELTKMIEKLLAT